jgi:predicted secreted acid phosphatase
MRTVICDIDGTVAIHEGRRDHFEWALVKNDLYNVPVCNLVSYIMQAGTLVLFVSGREEVCRRETLEWLCEMWPGVESEHLMMRSTKDYRQDTVVKREIFERDIAPYYDVEFVIDDRDSVVDMWRDELNLTCLQVARGDF